MFVTRNVSRWSYVTYVTRYVTLLRLHSYEEFFGLVVLGSFRRLFLAFRKGIIVVFYHLLLLTRQKEVRVSLKSSRTPFLHLRSSGAPCHRWPQTPGHVFLGYVPQGSGQGFDGTARWVGYLGDDHPKPWQFRLLRNTIEGHFLGTLFLTPTKKLDNWQSTIG